MPLTAGGAALRLAGDDLLLLALGPHLRAIPFRRAEVLLVGERAVRIAVTARPTGTPKGALRVVAVRNDLLLLGIAEIRLGVPSAWDAAPEGDREATRHHERGGPPGSSPQAGRDIPVTCDHERPLQSGRTTPARLRGDGKGGRFHKKALEKVVLPNKNPPFNTRKHPNRGGAGQPAGYHDAPSSPTAGVPG